MLEPSLTQILIVLIIVLIIFGPKRLPELGRSLGRGIREFKGSVSGDKDHDSPEEKRPELQASQPTQPTPAESATKPAEPVEGEVVTEHKA